MIHILPSPWLTEFDTLHLQIGLHSLCYLLIITVGSISIYWVPTTNRSMIQKLGKCRWKVHSSWLQEGHSLMKAESYSRVGTVIGVQPRCGEKERRGGKWNAVDERSLASCHLFWLLLVRNDFAGHNLVWHLVLIMPTFVANLPCTRQRASCFTYIIPRSPHRYPARKVPILFSSDRRGPVAGKGKAGIQARFCSF